MKRKRTIAHDAVLRKAVLLGSVLGIGLLGTLIALAQDDMPRPRPVAPPPSSEIELPVLPKAKPAAPMGPKSVSRDDAGRELNSVIVPAQHVESKPPEPKRIADKPPALADVPALETIPPLPPTPLPTIVAPPPAPPVMPPAPAPAPNLDLPPIPNAAPQAWTPNDTPVVPESMPVDRTPKDVAPALPPQPIPVNDVKPKTSRFVVAPRSTASQPAHIPEPDANDPPRPGPYVAPPPDVPPVGPSHGIRYFQPIRRPGLPTPATPASLPKLNDLSKTPRPSVLGSESSPRTGPSDGASTATATPQLTVEKRGPLLEKASNQLKYQILVRNVGAVAAQSVRVEDEVPGARLLVATPDIFQQQGDRLVWVLPGLRPGEERTLMEELQPIRAGAVVSTTSVHVYATTSFRTHLDGEASGAPPSPIQTPNNVSGPSLVPGPAPLGVQGPLLTLPNVDPTPTPPNDSKDSAAAPPTPDKTPMTVEVKALPTVELGKKLVFEVVVSNTGTTPLTRMMLYGKIPTGFSHPEGENIGADLPDLPAGETKVYKMPVTAATPGRHAVEIRVTAAPNFELIASPTIVVESRVLTIQQSGGPLALGRDGDIRITVSNNQPAPIGKVRITDVLPEGLEFVGASDQGTYQPTTRTATWTLDAVPGGRSRMVTLRVRPKSSGSYTNEVAARADGQPESTSIDVYAVENTSPLQVKLQGRDKIIEKGQESVFAVRIRNAGPGVANNVHVVVSLSEGLEPTGFAQAPTVYRISGRDVAFNPIPRLPPGAMTTIHLGVRGTAPGPRSVRAQIVSDESRSPMTFEETTEVVEKK